MPVCVCVHVCVYVSVCLCVCVCVCVLFGSFWIFFGSYENTSLKLKCKGLYKSKIKNHMTKHLTFCHLI